MTNAAVQPVHLTLGQWGDLDEVDGELVDGVLVEEEMPTVIHETIVAFLVHLFRTWTGRHGGFVFGSELRIAVTTRRGRKPDVSVYLPKARKPGGRDRLVTVPPSIVVEVITDTPRDARRDRIEKAAEYAAFGVRWYWLVDPELRSIEIFELGRDGHWRSALAAVKGRVRVPACRGLVLDVSKLWREVDALLD
jgi:Uma2 family endonuclease